MFHARGLSLFVVLGVVACQSEQEPQPGEGSKSAPAAAASDVEPAAEDPATGLEAALQAAVKKGVQPPGMDDATYRVDAFVAALLFEHLRASGGEPTLTRYEPPQGQPQPAAGYRVGPLKPDSIYATLGLAEGDVIEGVNGVPLSDPSALGPALDGAEHRVTVEVFREDVSFTLSYRLVGGIAWREVLAGYTGTSEETPPVPADEAIAMADPEPHDDPQPRGGGAHVAPSDPDEGGDGGGSSAKLPSQPSQPRAKPKKPSPRPSPAPTPSPSPSKPDSVRCASSTRCTIDEAYFQELVAVPSRLQSQVDVVPAIRNDVFSGYKLKRIKPGSAAAKLGFRPDDKITHINGRDLTDDAQALQVYLGLSATKVFKIRYERGGRKLVKTVVVE